MVMAGWNWRTVVVASRNGKHKRTSLIQIRIQCVGKATLVGRSVGPLKVAGVNHVRARNLRSAAARVAGMAGSEMCVTAGERYRGP